MENGKISRAAYLPCLINTQGKPEIHGNDAKGQQVFDYIQRITAEAGLKTRYEWDGDEFVVTDY